MKTVKLYLIQIQEIINKYFTFMYLFIILKTNGMGGKIETRS